MEKKLSVVIPTYHRPELLVRCLNALTAQSFPAEDFEVIVVSDGPDTVTTETVRAVNASNIHALSIHSLTEKKGPAAARNHGWKSAKGKLIAFTDDDCIPDVHWLSSLWKAYREERFIAFSGKVHVPVSGVPTDYERNIMHLETADFITANCCCTKQTLMRIGGFDERFTNAWREDSDLEFKLLEVGIPIRRVAEAIVVHPVREASWGVSMKEQKKGIFNALLYKKYPRLYRERIQAQPAWTYCIICSSFLLMLFTATSGWPFIAALAGICWLSFTIQFILKRLSGTSHTFSHVMEMIVSSLAIPFLSVYWQLYGAFKYKVLFL